MRTENCRHWLRVALVAVAILIGILPKAQALEPGCGTANTDWIAGCTAIIDSPAVPETTRAKALRARGIAQFKRGAYDEAIADFSAAITLDPKEPWIWLERGNAYKKMRDFARARADYDEAIRLGPKVSTFLRDRGLLRKEQGDPNGALADFEAAVQVNPDDVLSLLKLGDMRLDRENYDSALAYYDKALSVRPESPQLTALVHSARGMLFVAKDDLSRALAEYDTLLTIVPDDPVYLVSRGYIAFAIGDFAKAAADFGASLQKRPNVFYTVLMRYVARARMGERDTPELRSNAQVLDRGWPWPVVGLYLGEVTPEDLRAATQGPESEDTTRRKCDVAFFLAEYDLLRRRRIEAAKLMEDAAKTCTFDRLIRRAAIAEAERIRQ